MIVNTLDEFKAHITSHGKSDLHTSLRNKSVIQNKPMYWVVADQHGKVYYEGHEFGSIGKIPGVKVVDKGPGKDEYDSICVTGLRYAAWIRLYGEDGGMNPTGHQLLNSDDNYCYALGMADTDTSLILMRKFYHVNGGGQYHSYVIGTRYTKDGKENNERQVHICPESRYVDVDSNNLLSFPGGLDVLTSPGPNSFQRYVNNC
jgi:hypothetical protein